MEYRILGKTGLKVSSVGVGCWQMGGVASNGGWTGTTDVESIATIHYAESLGINLLDSAETYGIGHSEQVIGKALKGRRRNFVVATKVSPIVDDPDEDNATKRIIEACEGSLRRLGTDYIDIYQLHAVPHESTMPAVMNALGDLKREGKVRWFGISTNDVVGIRKLLDIGDLATLQIGYNLLDRSGEKALRLANAEDLGTLIRVPMASGALSGKYFNTSPQLDAEDVRRDRWASEKAEPALRKLSKLLFLTEEGKRTMVQAALRFVLDTQGVTSVIPGAKSRKQLEENAGAMDVESLTEEELCLAMSIADGAGWFWWQ